MNPERSMPEMILADAELVAGIAADELKAEMGYDEAGVRWLDGFIERQHATGDPAIREKLTSTLGSYLGTCIIETYGGEWVEDEGSWCVRFSAGNAAFPFNKTAKHLENGREGGDSVLAFFTAIPTLFKERK